MPFSSSYSICPDDVDIVMENFALADIEEFLINKFYLSEIEGMPKPTM